MRAGDIPDIFITLQIIDKDHVQKYIDIGMFNADPEDHYDGGEIGIMPVISTKMERISAI